MTKSIPTLPIGEIIRLYTSDHLACKYIAKRYHVQPYVIRGLLHANNISTRWVSHKAKIDLGELERLYSVEHLPSTEIAKRFRVTSPTILNALHEHNIPVRDSHRNEFNKTYITKEKLHPNLIDIKVTNGKRFGVAKCPICQELRTISLHGKSDINFTGVCPKCAGVKRTIPVDINIAKSLYLNDLLTAKAIGQRFNVSVQKILAVLKDNNVPIRPKTESHKRVIHNNGTIERPVLEDICRGTDIGLRDRFYYIWVECPTCHHQRWQGLSHFTGNHSPLCRTCSLKRMGENHRGENAPVWHGGISFEPYTPDFNRWLKEEIRKRDNHTCQLCGQPQNGKALAVHHIDYNKKNTTPDNLISLCTAQKGQMGCHNKTNHHREYWQLYFMNLLKQRGVLSTPLNSKQTLQLNLFLTPQKQTA